MKVSELIEQLQTRYSPDAVVCAPIWSVEDIQQQANDEGITITKSQCESILDTMERKHDACEGVNWGVISAWIDSHERDKAEDRLKAG